MKQSTQPNSSSKTPLKALLLLALLGTLMFVVQIVLAVFTNVELVTALIIVTATVFGWKSLISVYIFVVLELLFHGIGLWNIMYLYVWSILVVIVMLTRRFATPFINAIIAAFFGLFFGTLCSIPYFVSGGVVVGVGWIIQGIPYDIIHCVANFILVYLAFTPCIKVLKKAFR